MVAQVDTQLSTGLPGLDGIFKGLIPGDNLVWQIDSLEDYKFFLKPYCESARARGRKLVYFRFAKHEPLVGDDWGAEVRALHPEAGFEKFVSEVHRTVAADGRGAFYVFDCLSDLVIDWYSDQMLGNFFMLTCPFLFDVEAIAYFALYRGRHSSDAISTIHETAQVVIDLFRHKEKLFVHPLKVQQRYSYTMYMLHVWDGAQFLPVTESAVISEIMMSVPCLNLEAKDYQLGYCNATFRKAQDVWDSVRTRSESDTELKEQFRLLLKMVVSRDERVVQLAEKYLAVSDLLEIRKRMIGTGLIGGKSVGMLIARAILAKRDERWRDLLEAHDSFYIGSDVFYTFVVRNGNWWIREKQKNAVFFLEGADKARRRMITGKFPDSVVRQFAEMLDYFGQSPIIVRSSSLLEDNFGNSFSGKYDSIFCANQGSREQRLEDFMTAVRTIYAGTMSEKALSYRAQRGLLERDEQMALLVQRVSGSMYGRLFFPQAAGVGYSYNPYAWCKHIDPEAGMVRLVFGLGTRAVDRADDDYTRIVALNAPERRTEANFDKLRKYAQRKVDVIDLDSNQLVSSYFPDVAAQSPGLDLELFVSTESGRGSSGSGKGAKKETAHRLLTFERLLKETSFVPDIREMLAILEDAYSCSVDIEFAANFFSGGFRINLLQCRPLSMKGDGVVPEPPAVIPPYRLVLEAFGAVIGKGRAVSVDRIVYVAPEIYGKLPIGDRYAVARLIGRVMHHEEMRNRKTIMLVGPGRWGTSMPELGVPVSFQEINNVSVLCEIVAMNENLIPDVSLGTHFFNDLVESDILYLALFPETDGNSINESYFTESPNMLAELVPDAVEWAGAVRVIDTSGSGRGGALTLNANTTKQKVLCYLEK